MPLNMVRPAFVCFLAIGADRLAGHSVKVLARQLRRARLQRRQTLLPYHDRRMEEYRLIDEIGFD
jgi:type VI protein secretion system component VasA